MNKQELLKYIWQEKREKIISTQIYPLGVNITIENLNFNWHEIIYGILILLRSDTKRAFDWSRNWGRAIVSVHPYKSFSFKFTLDESTEEKLGVFLATKKSINPIIFLEDKYNIGVFKILLNFQPKMSLEGAILQIERMVDELVWCVFLKLKRQEEIRDKKDICEISLYAQAVDIVFFNGVSVKYVDEDFILDQKKKNPSLPIRMYGDILKTEKIPCIIGMAVIPEIFSNVNVDRNIVDILRNEILTSMIKKQFSSVDLPKNKSKNINDYNHMCVCVGITPAKTIHIGHLLLLRYAEFIRKITASKFPIFLEANDVGDRIIGIIARFAEKYNISADEAVAMFKNQQISEEEINMCYKERQIKGYLFSTIKEKMSKQPYLSLDKIILQFTKILNRCGFLDLLVIKDSVCYDQYAEIINNVKNDLSQLGFHFVKYNSGSKKKMVVFEKQGLPTANLMRAAFVTNVTERCGKKILPIFIDASSSMSQTADVLRLFMATDLISTEGCAVGFNLKMSAGTDGVLISGEELFDVFYKQRKKDQQSSLFFATLGFFILTRDATVHSYKKHDLDQHHPSGISFFDYKNNQSFINDFLLSADELITFVCSIKKAINRIASMKSQSCDSVIVDKNVYAAERVKHIFNSFFSQNNRLEQLILKPKVIKVEHGFKKIQEKLYRQYCFKEKSHTHDEVNKIIVKAIMKGCNNFKDLANFFPKTNNSFFSKKNICEQELLCVFIKSLHSRGYGVDEIPNLTMKYIDGDFCLLRKRVALFEQLKEMICFSEAILVINEIHANLLLQKINTWLDVLGFRAILY